MDFLYKLEHFLNSLILKCADKLLAFIPPGLRQFFGSIDQRVMKLIAFFKALPANVKGLTPSLRAAAKSFDPREKILLPLMEAGAKYSANQKEKAGKFKVIFVAPILLFTEWFKSLAPAHALLLLFFSGASILSTISIISSSSRLMQGSNAARTPASVEEVSYDRPVYYKKDAKHVTITNFRLPVYLPEVNELKSVDIDFTATMSTREGRMFVEKMEFQLRDYLIHEIEPSVATFPLSDEGKEVIRQKLQSEVDHFLKIHKVKSHVEDLKVVYILAN